MPSPLRFALAAASLALVACGHSRLTSAEVEALSPSDADEPCSLTLNMQPDPDLLVPSVEVLFDTYQQEHHAFAVNARTRLNAMEAAGNRGPEYDELYRTVQLYEALDELPFSPVTVGPSGDVATVSTGDADAHMSVIAYEMDGHGWGIVEATMTALDTALCTGPEAEG